MTAAMCPAGKKSHERTPPAGFGSRINESPGFVAYAAGRAPSVGDSISLIEIVNNKREFHHCGIVVRSSLDLNELWLTADGGQPDRTEEFKESRGQWERFYLAPDVGPGFQSTEGAYIVPRCFVQSTSDPGRVGLGNLFIFPTDAFPGHRLEGWTDITHPGVRFDNPAYDTAYGREEDYRELKKIALDIPDRVFADLDRCAAKRGVDSLTLTLKRDKGKKP